MVRDATVVRRVAVELVYWLFIGVAIAVIVKAPLRAGSHEQVTVYGELVAVAFEIQPGIRLLFTKN